MPKFRIAQTTNVKLVRALHDQLFPETEFEGVGNTYWLVYDEHGGAVGFASCRPSVVGADTAFLSRAGVVYGSRGHGLQRRLIRARLTWARKQGFTRAITFAHWDNVPSLRSLVKEGFLPYRPEERLDGEWVYLERGL